MSTKVKTKGEFTDAIVKEMQKRYPDSDVVIKSIIKSGYDAPLTGLVISDNDNNIVPTVYLDDIYNNEYLTNAKRHSDDYIALMAAADIVEDIYVENKLDKPFNIDTFNDWDQAKDHLFLTLENVNYSREFIKEHVFKTDPDLNDLGYALRYEVATKDTTNMASIAITPEHLKYWGVTADEAIGYARQNMEKLHPAKVEALGSMLTDLMGYNPYSTEETEKMQDAMPTFVVTNDIMTKGAVAMEYKDVLHDLSDKIGRDNQKDFIILPSSIHEVIVTPVPHCDLNQDRYESLCNMVRDINREEVAPEDRLSDHVYFYDYERDLVYNPDFERDERNNGPDMDEDEQEQALEEKAEEMNAGEQEIEDDSFTR